MNLSQLISEVRRKEPPPPPTGPPTIFGIPIVECSDPSVIKDDEILLGSFVTRYPLKMEVRGGKIIGILGEPL